jgi:glutamate carboxypeptidase
MKGGLVVVAFALKALAATRGLQSTIPVRAVVVSDEEVGSPEGQGVIAAAISGSSACLVFEAGRAHDAVITRRKGTGAMTVVAFGRAAHAGNAHEEGRNAIWALARWVDGVQCMTDYATGITVNVGRIVGGSSKNTVPDRAQADVDLRFSSRADGDRLANSIRAVAAAVASSMPGIRLEVSGGVSRNPLERTEASERLYREYAACAKAHGLGDGEAPIVGGGSDASTASALGIAAIDGLGPRGTGFHTRDERIEVASLVPKAAALAAFLARRSTTTPDSA